LAARGLGIGSRIRDVDLEFRRGEIVSLCGLLGMGQTEIARALIGDGRDVGGSMTVGGFEGIPRSPRHAVRLGAGLVPDDRQAEGLFLDMSVRSNISIASLRRIVVSPLIRLIS